jgi:Protein of unknown function (DUF2688)
MRKRKQKIEFHSAPCKRGCGKQVTTASRSMWGLGELKRKYELICSDCMTRKEHEEILSAMGDAIMGRISA